VEKNWDIVKTIIKSGADVNLVSKNGKLSVEVCVEKCESFNESAIQDQRTRNSLL
jgi:hypothetical protein